MFVWCHLKEKGRQAGPFFFSRHLQFLLFLFGHVISVFFREHVALAAPLVLEEECHSRCLCLRAETRRCLFCLNWEISLSTMITYMVIYGQCSIY